MTWKQASSPDSSRRPIPSSLKSCVTKRDPARRKRAQLQANSEKTLRGTHWFRYDLRTGKRSGEPVRLDATYDAFNFNQTVIAMAMSRDGKCLALRHPQETSRIDVYEAEGTRSHTFTPYAANVPVQWVGWSGSGKLLTLGDGKLTGWSIPEGKAALEIEGQYHVPVRQVRGNAWLAAPASDHIDLLDTETGACLGRCILTGNDHDASRETDMAIAVDGTGLFYHALHKKPDWQRVGVVFGWDLTTGQAMPPVVSDRPPGGGMEAIDRQRLLLGGAFDVKAGVVYATYMVPPARTYDWFPLPPQNLIPGSPDGRMWTWGLEPGAEDSRRYMLRAVEFPGIETGPTSAQIFTKATPLRVEVDMGDKTRSEVLGKNLLKALQAQGFTIGKGDWTLKATCDVKSSDTNLSMKGWGGKVNVLEVALHYKLFSPEGELAHATGMTLQLGTGSKYFRGQRQVSQKGIEITLELTWEFPDRNPREAIIEELLEDIGTGGVRSDELRLPAPIGKIHGKFDLLPRRRTRSSRQCPRRPINETPVATYAIGVLSPFSLWRFHCAVARSIPSRRMRTVPSSAVVLITRRVLPRPSQPNLATGNAASDPDFRTSREGQPNVRAAP